MDIEKPVPAVAFIVSAGEEHGIARHRSFGWRVEARSTSFYIKVMHPGMNDFKISLHGPDDRPQIGPPILKLGYESTTGQRGSTEDRVVGPDVILPLVFAGQRITPHVRRVIRFNFTSDLFAEDLPLGYDVKSSKSVLKSGHHAKWTMPNAGGLHVDVYLSEAGADPYWPNKEAIKAARAGLGPLVNTAGQSLSLVATRVKSPHNRDPNHQPLTDAEVADLEPPLVRWVSMKPDKNGLLWITEKVGPAKLDADDA
ncbi:hypothetical protein MUG78_07940 [Gordonia alkaliphila]|uniref:hypothetical protein n=1 Tax=Gordonia alkaliphila TaxID=1053547 RepID=UPI001FF50B3E|nr:hypothetical protein [Gordonia alkaliphila]MCK0439391.1 hypothetical protein [Gordonia alkaliphila]